MYNQYQPASHHKLIADALEQIERGELTRLIIAMPPRHGKQCSDNTKILTTDGWKTHGDLSVGDCVYSPRGCPVRVVAVSEKTEATVKVEFTNGEYVVCHPNHEWTLYDRARSKTVTLETKDLFNRSLHSGPYNRRGGRYVLQLPRVESLENNDVNFKVNPYTLGVWLGDGKSSDGSYCCSVEDSLNKHLESIGESFGSIWYHKGTGVQYQTILGLREKLRDIGVLDNKHIPDKYYAGSVGQRLELLAGLVDTDGSVDKHGRIHIVTVSEILANDIRKLVSSFGWRASIVKSEPTTSTSGIVGKKPVYKVSFNNTIRIPTRLERKSYNQKLLKIKRRIAIKNVSNVSPEKGHCIQVDSDDGLYLVTEQLIPTHNSMLASQFFPAWYIGRNPENQIITTSASQELAQDFGRNVRNHINDELYQYVFPNIMLSKDSQSSKRFNTNHGGVYHAVGMGGTINGRGAHLLVIDDPIKNRQDADSDSHRKKLKDWYSSVAYPRLMPGNSAIIVIACMTGDTILTKEDGSKTTLGVVEVGDRILSWSENGPVYRPVTNKISHGYDDVYEIKTGNSTFKANARHPFLFKSQAGKYKWVRVKDFGTLNITDRLVHLPSRPGKIHDVDVNESEAFLLGFMFGDGWITNRSSTNYDKVRDKHYPRRGSVTCFAYGICEDLNNYILNLFEELFGVVPKKTPYGYYRTEVQSVAKRLQDLGFAGTARTKRIPEWVYKAPDTIRQAFLNGFVAADGHDRIQKNGQRRVSVQLCNKDLLQDLRHVVSSLGYAPTNISTSTYTVHPPNSPSPIEATSFTISWNPGKIIKGEFYRKIRSCTLLEEKEEVFDIEVEGTECFVANGVVSHNTRWHEDDLTGWLLKEHSHENWKVLELPVINEKTNVPLWPEAFDFDAVSRIKKSVTKREWNALYMQRPHDDEGNIIKRNAWQMWPKNKPFPKAEFIVQSYDTAYSEKDVDTTSRSARTTWGLFTTDRGHKAVMLMEAWADRVDYPKLKYNFLKSYDAWKPDRSIIEKKASGQSLIQDLRRSGISVSTYQPDRDKIVRAYAVQPLFESGLIYFPDRAWAEEVIDECTKFPNGRNDDFVDTVTQALLWFRSAGLLEVNLDWSTFDHKDYIISGNTADEEEDEDNVVFIGTWKRKNKRAPAYG